MVRHGSHGSFGDGQVSKTVAVAGTLMSERGCVAFAMRPLKP